MTKSEWRSELRRRLAEIGEETRTRAADVVATHIQALPEFQGARVVLAYLSLVSELSVDRVIADTLAAGRRVVVPRVANAGELGLLEIHDLKRDVAPGFRGIREPNAICATVPVEQVNFALIPGLGFDATGLRLGRGGGYYDRLLARPEFAAFRCGVAFECQRVPALPADDWDQRVAAVVTDAGPMRY